LAAQLWTENGLRWGVLVAPARPDGIAQASGEHTLLLAHPDEIGRSLAANLPAQDGHPSRMSGQKKQAETFQRRLPILLVTPVSFPAEVVLVGGDLLLDARGAAFLADKRLGRQVNFDKEKQRRFAFAARESENTANCVTNKATGRTCGSRYLRERG